MTTDGLPHQVLAKLETTLALSHAEDAARLEAELQQARAALQGAAEQHRRQLRQLCARFDVEREQLIKSTKRHAARHAARHAHHGAISEPSTPGTPTTTPMMKKHKSGARAGRRSFEVDLRDLDDFPAGVVASVADGADERLRLGRTCDPGGDGLVARLWDVLAGPDKGQGKAQGKAQGKVRKSRASAFNDSAADNAILGDALSPAKAVTGAASSATKRASASRGKNVAAALALRPPPLGPPRAPPLSSLLQSPLQSQLLDSPPSSMPSSPSAVPSAGAALFDRGDVAEPSSDGRWRQPRPPPLRIRSPHTSLLGSPVQAVQAVH